MRSSGQRHSGPPSTGVLVVIDMSARGTRVGQHPGRRTQVPAGTHAMLYINLKCYTQPLVRPSNVVGLLTQCACLCVIVLERATFSFTALPLEAAMGAHVWRYNCRP